MAARWFIINEWLLHDLLGDNGEKAQEESSQFLDAFIQQADGIIVLASSPWMDKAGHLMAQSTLPLRRISQRLQRGILRDSQQCRILQQEELRELPAELRNLLSEGKIDSDDEYLLQIWCSAPVAVNCLVTTDTRLRQALAEHYPGIRTVHRDEFLANYPAPPPGA